MKTRYRIFLSLLVFLLGIVMIPVVGLPAAGFNWQRFANVYVPTTLEIDHRSGQPGSFFTLTGTNYPVEASLEVHINGVLVGNVQSDASGSLVFLISTAGAETGDYVVVVGNMSQVFTRFELDAQAPLWPQVVEAPVLALPTDIASELIFLPVIREQN